MNGVKTRGWVALAALVWAGCGGNDQGGDGSSQAGTAGSSTAGTHAAGTGGGGSGGKGGSGGSGGERDGTPLLERPAELAYDCEVTRSMALLGLNPWVAGGVHLSDGSAYLTRLQGTMPGLSVGMKVTWSSLGFDGALGSAQSLPAEAQTYLGQLTSTQVDEQLALLWTESTANDSQLMLAGVEATGDVTVPRAPLTSGAGQRNFPVFTAVSEGYAVAWTRPSVGGAGGSTIELVLVGADGKPSGDVATVVEGTGNLQSQELVPHAGGLALLYSRVDYATNVQGNFYQRLDSNGARQGEPVKLGDGFGAVSSLRRGDELLVAWTEQTGDFDGDMTRTIHVGAIGASGELIGSTYALQAPVVDEENVDPHWVDMGDDVGLFWSQGSIIYICAGCFPDNQLKFVVLGGDDFTRRSEVLSLASPNVFGLRSPLAVRSGEEILALASVTHHVDAEGASATLRCAP